MQHTIRIHRETPVQGTTLFRVRCSCGLTGIPTTDIGEARFEEAMHHHAERERGLAEA